MVLENLLLLKNLITNSRFRTDIKSLKYAKICYITYAWEFIEELDLINYLSKYRSLKEIQKFAEIKDNTFIETVLDLLVGSGNIKYNNNKYKVVHPPNFDLTKELKHLENFCPGSTEWTHWLRKKSKLAIQNGLKVNESSFDEKKGIQLWEKLMRESPYSLRQITIDQIEKKFKNNNKIIDIGCGGGIGLEEILIRSKKPIRLYGLEISKNYIKNAKNRVVKLSKELTGVKKENAKKTKFLVENLVNKTLSKKFDAIFLSLVTNHIAVKDRPKFYSNLKKMMKPDSILVTFQFVHQSKFERSPMWVMHNIPSHKDFPYKTEFIQMLNDIFPHTKSFLNGTIVVCKLTK